MDETRDLSQQHVLVRIEDAVRIGDLPQHLDDPNPLLHAQAFGDFAREGKVLSRVPHLILCRLDELAHRFGRKVKPLGEQSLDGGPLGGVEVLVHARRLDQQRGDGEL